MTRSFALAGLEAKVIEQDTGGCILLCLDRQREPTRVPAIDIHFINSIPVDAEYEMGAARAHLHPIPFFGRILGKPKRWNMGYVFPAIPIGMITDCHL